MAVSEKLSNKSFYDAYADILGRTKEQVDKLVGECFTADDMLYVRGVYDGHFNALKCICERVGSRVEEMFITETKEVVMDRLLDRYDILLRKVQS